MNPKSFPHLMMGLFVLGLLWQCSGGGGGSDDASNSAPTGPTTAPSEGPGLPDAPSNLDVFEGNGQLRITWEAAASAVRYELRYKATGDPNYTAITGDEEDGITATNFVIDELSNGTPYQIHVRTVDAAGQASAWSLPVEGMPYAAVGPPSIVLVNNTGDEEDEFTTDATISIASQEGAAIDLRVTVNNLLYVFADGESEFAMPSEGETNIDLAVLAPSIVPVGAATNVIGLTATASKDGQTTPTTSPTTFVLVNAIAAADVTGIGLSLEEDTGDDDGITTNANLVASGALPLAVSIGFLVTTNGNEHAHDIVGMGTKDFGITVASESISVSITPTFERYGHSVVGSSAFGFTLLAWPPNFSSSYEDTGESASDGITFESEITMSGFDGIDGSDLDLIEYVLTNTDELTSTVVWVAGDGQTLDGEATIDMREFKPVLSRAERVSGLTFNYKGHTTTHGLSPPLKYIQGIGTYTRQFAIEENATGIAVTSDDIVLVSSSHTDAIHFYDTNGNPTNIDIGGEASASATSFGSTGSNTNLFRHPRDVAVGSDGKIYVADHYNDRIQIYNADFSYNASINLTDAYPTALCIHGGTLYATVIASTHRVYTYSEGNLAGGSNLISSGNLVGIGVDANNILHVLNSTSDRLEAWTGNPSTGFSERNHTYNLIPDSGSSTPTNNVMIGPTTGRIYAVDRGRDQVLVFLYDGNADSNHYTLVGTFGHATTGAIGSGNGEFHNPMQVLLHNSELYVVDRNNNRVQVFDVPE